MPVQTANFKFEKTSHTLKGNIALQKLSTKHLVAAFLSHADDDAKRVSRVRIGFILFMGCQGADGNFFYKPNVMLFWRQVVILVSFEVAESWDKKSAAKQ